jgi:hypothetical protein
MWLEADPFLCRSSELAILAESNHQLGTVTQFIDIVVVGDILQCVRKNKVPVFQQLLAERASDRFS